MTWRLIAPAANTPDNLSMVNISIKYTGDLHCDATHGPSHAKLATDAPTDQQRQRRSVFTDRFGRDRTWDLH